MNVNVKLNFICQCDDYATAGKVREMLHDKYPSFGFITNAHDSSVEVFGQFTAKEMDDFRANAKKIVEFKF
jgi:hypothetical protein